jgi:hypothetical protein
MRRPGTTDLDIVIIIPGETDLTDDDRLNRLANKILTGMSVAVIALAAAIHQGWIR